MRQKYWIPVLIIAFACVTSCEKGNEVSGDGEDAVVSRNSRTKSESGSRESSRAMAPGNKPAKRTVDGEFEHSLDLAEMAESSEERDKQIAALAWSMLESRLDLMELAMRRLPKDSPEKPGLIEAYLLRLLQSDPEEAIRWADSLGDSKDVLAAREHIALSLPPEQTARAVKLLLDARRIGSDGLDNASSRLLERWMTQTPVEAANWVATTLPVGESRSSAVRVIADQWVQTDMGGALAWIDSISDKEFRSEVMNTAGRYLSEMPVELRDELVANIQDPAALRIYETIKQMLPVQDIRNFDESPDTPADEAVSPEAVPEDGNP